MNHTAINTYGQRYLTFEVRRRFHFLLIIVDIKHAILGLYFLQLSGFLADISRSGLVDGTKLFLVSGILCFL